MTESWEGLAATPRGEDWAFRGAFPHGCVGVVSEEQSQVSVEGPLAVTAKAYL